MSVNWIKLKAVLTEQDANGNYRPAVRGDETDDELREIALEISSYCQAHPCAEHCPFAVLASLGSQSMTREIRQMSRQTLLDFFQMELDCRTHVFLQKAPENRPTGAV
jgi:hypothetical protein